MKNIVDAEGKAVCKVFIHQPEANDTTLFINRVISQQDQPSKNPVISFEVHHRAVKLVRPSQTYTRRVTPTARNPIKEFTTKSRSRLKFLAANCPQLISQFGMTYHKTVPDGATVKKHLNSFCTSLRRNFPGVGYLWILEFQSRGTAHFHLFTTLEPTTENGYGLAYLWHRVAEPDSPEHLVVHRHTNNFIAWSMGTGAYLTKYLSKESQKAVPQDFVGVGRFWGNSRGLLPKPEVIEACDLVAALGEHAVKAIVRAVGKHHEASLRHVNSRWRSGARTRKQSYTLPNAAGIFSQLCSNQPELAQPTTLLSLSLEEVAF